MLTNSLKTSDTTETEFFELPFLRGIKKSDKNIAVQI